jgi:hypothetical protein
MTNPDAHAITRHAMHRDSDEDVAHVPEVVVQTNDH